MLPSSNSHSCQGQPQAQIWALLYVPHYMQSGSWARPTSLHVTCAVSGPDTLAYPCNFPGAHGSLPPSLAILCCRTNTRLSSAALVQGHFGLSGATLSTLLLPAHTVLKPLSHRRGLSFAQLSPLLLFRPKSVLQLVSYLQRVNTQMYQGLTHWCGDRWLSGVTQGSLFSTLNRLGAGRGFRITM